MNKWPQQAKETSPVTGGGETTCDRVYRTDWSDRSDRWVFSNLSDLSDLSDEALAHLLKGETP